MMSIKEIKALLDEGKIVVLYKDENGYTVTEFPPRTTMDDKKKNIISDDNDRNTVVTTVDPRNFTTTTYGRDEKDYYVQ